VNAFVVGAGLLVALPATAIGERVRPGSGRAIAARASAAILRACGVRVAVEGDGPIDRGVLVPNHASLLDAPVLLIGLVSIGTPAGFVATAGVLRIPILAGAARAIGTVAIDRRRPVVARQQLAALAVSIPGPIVVFAQGAIPRKGEDLPFKSGAFALAHGLGAPVVPVAIAGTGRLLPRGRRLTIDPGEVTVRFLEPITTDGVHRRVLRDRTEAAVRAALP
jgi:1-acyl-sn-glycerol-3-phosphate acyltransferase